MYTHEVTVKYVKQKSMSLYYPCVTYDDKQMPKPYSESYVKQMVGVILILTKLELVLLLSSSGMGRNTAKAIQFAKIVNKMMISKVLNGLTQDYNNNT